MKMKPKNCKSPQQAQVFNTEYMKVTSSSSDHDGEPVSDEIIMHLLGQEKADVVQKICQLTGQSSKGSRIDMLVRLRNAGLSRAKFDQAYSEVISHSGGWLSGTCPHNVTYAIKFLLRSESPRDYVDLLRSFVHVPSVNIIDIAHSVAKLANKIEPTLFSVHEGRVAEATECNINAAAEKRLTISIPALANDEPASTSSDNQHPVSGMEYSLCLFDWFHEANCKSPIEVLRRPTLVKQIAGYANTQAAEQLHSDKGQDIYWLNKMGPINHIFVFKMLVHLNNTRINEKELKREQRILVNFQPAFNSLGQVIRANTDQQGVKKDTNAYSHHAQNKASPGSNFNQAAMGHSRKLGSKQADDTRIIGTQSIVHQGRIYRKQTVQGDGNCLFRAVCRSAPWLREADHARVRREAYEWCLTNSYAGLL